MVHPLGWGRNHWSVMADRSAPRDCSGVLRMAVKQHFQQARLQPAAMFTGCGLHSQHFDQYEMMWVRHDISGKNRVGLGLSCRAA